VVEAVVRTTVGAYETVTFLVPIPSGYAPILPPLRAFTGRGPKWPEFQ
jgi:hypothetical protein